jgi:hypothetical protein
MISKVAHWGENPWGSLSGSPCRQRATALFHEFLFQIGRQGWSSI